MTRERFHPDNARLERENRYANTPAGSPLPADTPAHPGPWRGTPAPWSVERYLHEHHRNGILHTPHGNYVLGWDSTASVAQAQHDADMNLMADAPRLRADLAACVEALGALHTYVSATCDDYAGGGEINGVDAMAVDALLARVKGRA